MHSSKSASKTILSFETSAEFASVSLQRDTFELYGATFFLPMVHANVIAPLIEKAIGFTGLNWSGIDAIAIGKGPGSYTGLRIATSVAKGICMATNIPLISVSTLENIANQAFQVETECELALVSIDARRNEIFAAIYDRNLNAVLKPRAMVLGEIDVEHLVFGKSVVFAGSGTSKTLNYFNSNFDFCSLTGIFPTAQSLGQLALKKLNQSDFEDLTLFEPDYLKPVYIS